MKSLCTVIFSIFMLSDELTNALSHSRTRKFSVPTKSAFFDRRQILIGALIAIPSSAKAATDEGIPAITDSSIGKTFRKSIIQGARVADNLDEKWERFSDSLRDKSKCDEATGRRLFDNGYRKDGTQVGNPVLGNLCNPESLLPLDEIQAMKILDIADKYVTTNDLDSLQKAISSTKDLVRPSFDRSIQASGNDDERKRLKYNFEVYSRMRSINNILGNNDKVRNFQLQWGKELLSNLAPNANRKDYVSPFPNIKDEFEDYDYDKEKLLDGLGALKVAMDKLKMMGVIGYYELSIPYDDYGSVVTIAIDDYVPIGAEMLLSEQKYNIAGVAQAMVRAALAKADVAYNLDTFYLDPSTTKQNEYNPTQLLLSVSNLRKT